jgi:chromosome segregation ATPase
MFHTLNCHVESLHEEEVAPEAETGTLADNLGSHQTEHADINNNHEALQTERNQLQEEIDNLHTLCDQRQRNCDEAQAVITTVTAERDLIQTQLQDLQVLSAQRQMEHEELQTRNIAVIVERDQFQQRCEALRTANVALTVEGDRLRAAEIRSNQALNNIQRNIANLAVNFPNNARFLCATPHQINPNIVLTKDGRPDLRYKQGKPFSHFRSDTSFVIHNGKRVCIMITTASER